MTMRVIGAECPECDSYFVVNYKMELSSKEMPSYCPFCGCVIDEDELDDITDDEPEDNLPSAMA